MIRKIEKILVLSILLIISVCASAQSGTYGAYSPYSIFGVGNISKEGTAFNKSMGGVGIATRNKRFINYLNPAAINAEERYIGKLNTKLYTLKVLWADVKSPCVKTVLF